MILAFLNKPSLERLLWRLVVLWVDAVGRSSIIRSIELFELVNISTMLVVFAFEEVSITIFAFGLSFRAMNVSCCHSFTYFNMQLTSNCTDEIGRKSRLWVVDDGCHGRLI